MSEYACLGLRYNLKDYKLISKSGRLRSKLRVCYTCLIVQSKVFYINIIIDMNYYAKMYNDDSNSDDIQVHISIIEGIYGENLCQKARVIGDINITKKCFCKYVKQPYDVINTDEYTITLKKTGETTYTLLSHLLASVGYTTERITQLTIAIHNISNNTLIKTNQNCYKNWISFD